MRSMIDPNFLLGLQGGLVSRGLPGASQGTAGPVSRGLSGMATDPNLVSNPGLFQAQAQQLAGPLVASGERTPQGQALGGFGFQFPAGLIDMLIRNLGGLL